MQRSDEPHHTSRGTRFLQLTVMVMTAVIFALVGTLLLLGPSGAAYRVHPAADGILGLCVDFALKMSAQVGQGWTFVALFVTTLALVIAVTAAVLVALKMASQATRATKAKATTAKLSLANRMQRPAKQAAPEGNNFAGDLRT